MTARLDADTLALLAESLERYRTQSYTFERRNAALASNVGFDRDAWTDYAAFGWLRLALPSTQDGFGEDARGIDSVMAHAGRGLMIEPIFGSAVLCARVLARCDAAGSTDALESMATGVRIFALAHAESAEDGFDGKVTATLRNGRLHGTKVMALHGDVADRFVVTARTDEGALALALVAADAPGVARECYRLVDGRGAGTAVFSDAPCERSIVVDAHAFEAALDDARLALCAEAWGAVTALNAATTEYLKTRMQFGRPLAANQALQHRMVELVILAEELRAVVDSAERASLDDRPRAIAAACAHAATVARCVAHEAVQLHGGMGITAELPVSHYFKRLMVTARLMGDRKAALRKFAEAKA